MKIVDIAALSGGLLLIMMLVAYPVSDARADARPCSSKEAIAAEQEASAIRSWDALYRSYKKYSHCDDGAISEGYSYSVAKLLVEHWEEFDKLFELTRQSSNFEDFIVSHINETMSQDEAKQVLRNLDKCPESGKKLCDRVRGAIIASS